MRTLDDPDLGDERALIIAHGSLPALDVLWRD